ncbi:FadR/GntR family transcriptional regulator [Microbacterium sp. NPDC091313]
MTDTRDDAGPAPRAWEVVLERIETDLREGRLRPGDRLAGERDLASQLGVGRSSVREALRVLEVLGLLRTSTGSGPQAGAMIVATPRGGLSALLRLQVAANGFPVDDVVRTRIVLESASVEALAAADARDTASVHAILDAMDAERLSPAEFLALDAELHVALTEASGNIVAAAMMAGLRTAIESYVLTGATALSDWTATAERLRSEHRDIVAAVDDGRTQDAGRLVREHITRYYAEAGLSGAPEKRTD